MIEKLQSIIDKYKELTELSISPDVVSNQKECVRISKEISNIKEQYELAVEYLKYTAQLDEAKEILNDESDTDMIDMAKEQKKEAEAKLEKLNEKLKIALLPQDPNDDKNIFLEIRPAAGGDEAALFAAELLKMYLTYAQ
jgi:peptide chain release factor 1